MKIDCGPTWPEKKAALEQWHDWFAWYPVRVAPHDCRWLERVDRKGTLMCEGWGDSWWVWQYRTKGDENENKA